jgi:hypothetical protein
LQFCPSLLAGTQLWAVFGTICAYLETIHDLDSVTVKFILGALNMCSTLAEFVQIYSIKTTAKSFENGAEFEYLGMTLTNHNCIDELIKSDKILWHTTPFG